MSISKKAKLLAMEHHLGGDCTETMFDKIEASLRMGRKKMEELLDSSELYVPEQLTSVNTEQLFQLIVEMAGGAEELLADKKREVATPPSVFELTDDSSGKTLSVEIETIAGSLYIKPAGYGEEPPIKLDFFDERLRLMIYQTLGDEEPDEIIPLEKEVELLWAALGGVCVDEDGHISEPFMDFKEGTDREEIWRWIEEKYDVRVIDLMFSREKI